MSEQSERELAIDKLWIETEGKIARQFSPEDLRTSGILAGQKARWNSAALRLSEAARHGLRDLQVLDTLGEAAYRTKTPELLLSLQEFYTEPMIATHMARALFMLGDIAGARGYLRLAPDSNLKKALTALINVKNTIEEARDAMVPSLDKKMNNLDFPMYWQALSTIADVTGFPDVVKIAEERSKAVDYANPVIHYNQSLRFLHAKELNAGWRLYDWRLHPESGCALSNEFANVPMWQGEEMKDKTLLIILEYGFGDQIFSMRFIERAMKASAVVEIGVDEALFDLVKSSFPELKIHRLKEMKQPGYWENNQTADHWCYAFSLPSRLMLWNNVNWEGYLTAPKELSKAYQDEIAKVNSKKLPVVGLVWHGDIRTAPMRTRAYSIEEFIEQSGILEKPRLVINLQKDVTEEELKTLQKKVKKSGGILLDVSSTLTDFSHTAAWIDCTEQLYSCDTAVGHLGGALAKPTVVLIRNKAIWQWVLKEPSETGGQAFWYRSADVRFKLAPPISFMFDIREEEKSGA